MGQPTQTPDANGITWNGPRVDNTTSMFGSGDIAGLSMGASAASAVLSAGGAYASGKYQAQVAKNNSIIAQRNAVYAQQQGAVQALNVERKTSQTIAAQRAVAAANGIDVNSGSAAQAQIDSAIVGHENLDATVQGTAQAVAGYRNQSQQFKSDASADMFSGLVSAGGSILGGAASVGSKYLSYKSGYGYAATN